MQSLLFTLFVLVALFSSSFAQLSSSSSSIASPSSSSSSTATPNTNPTNGTSSSNMTASSSTAAASQGMTYPDGTVVVLFQIEIIAGAAPYYTTSTVVVEIQQALCQIYGNLTGVDSTLLCSSGAVVVQSLNGSQVLTPSRRLLQSAAPLTVNTYLVPVSTIPSFNPTTASVQFATAVNEGNITANNYFSIPQGQTVQVAAYSASSSTGLFSIPNGASKVSAVMAGVAVIASLALLL